MSNLEEIITFTERLISENTKNSLTFLQKIILIESLCENSKTYEQIAIENNYSEKYIRQVVAPKVWQLISAVFGEKVTRINCRAVIEKKLKDSAFAQNLNVNTPPEKILLEFPEGQVSLDSPFYVERTSIETKCYQEILQPGALIRIQGSRKIGKTSLLARTIAYSENHNYSTVRLDLHQAETEVFTSIKKMLRWICANATQQLKLSSKLDEYWDDDVGALMNCTNYMRSHIIENVSSPIVLAFDSIDQILDYPNIARDFFALLRSWYEISKDNLSWKKLRLIIIHVNDLYVNFKNHQSPFNVGLTVKIPPFNQTQIEDLVQRCGLKLKPHELAYLINLTGGLPYLVRLTLYYSISESMSLEILLQESTNKNIIFNKHLH
ncbi:MAG: AAA-like domain-containing protein, partial [Rhizonema sp. PD38]|nr:AAA-like domain-containing protein [Rhizonema sp. PD38]